MHEHRFHGDIAALRQPERLARLELHRVVRLAALEDGLHSVLDVGTGSGACAEAFTNAGLHVEGVDVSPEMLEAARGHLPNVTFHEAVAEALPVGEGSFDLVFLRLLLHETDDRTLALREAARVARKRVAVLEWPKEPQQAGPPPEDRVSEAEVRQLARDAGLGEVRIHRLTTLLFAQYKKKRHNG